MDVNATARFYSQTYFGNTTRSIEDPSTTHLVITSPTCHGTNDFIPQRLKPKLNPTLNMNDIPYFTYYLMSSTEAGNSTI